MACHIKIHERIWYGELDGEAAATHDGKDAAQTRQRRRDV
jgi:hypothetical protein